MYLADPPHTQARAALYDRDRADDGYVANLTRLWSWRADVFDAFVDLRKQLGDGANLSLRERAVLVCATAAAINDSYCALAWGKTLAGEAGPESAAAVLQERGAPGLSRREEALARWARQVARDPNSTRVDDVRALRDAGLSDEDIFNATVFVALRLAFSTVNDALGARPDHELASTVPPLVREAVTFGRPVADPS